MADASITGLSEHFTVSACHHRRLTVTNIRILRKCMLDPKGSASRRSAVCTNALQDACQLSELLKVSSTVSKRFTQNNFQCRQLQQCHRGSIAVQCVQAIERPSTPAASRESNTPRPQQITEASVAEWVLPEYDQSTGMVELVIAGAGPSGLAVAERVSQAGGFACPMQVQRSTR